MSITLSPLTADYGLWATWYATWLAAAFWASRPASRPRPGIAALHRVVASAGASLLVFVPVRPIGSAGGVLSLFAAPLWTAPAWADWGLVALTTGAFGFCWWARLHLGTLWSGFVTAKADHRIVDTGPYALVRHPIYTGVILAALTTAAIKASPAALLGFVLILAGFWMTARIEERFLRQELGRETYDAYAWSTPMLLPGFLARRSSLGHRG